MRNIIKRYGIRALLASSLLATTVFPQTSYAAGQYIHVKTADDAIAQVDPELRSILEERRELYKWGALFPDAMKYNNDESANNNVDNDKTHLAFDSPNFFNEYAQKIHDECFSEFVPNLLENSCAHRPDLACTFVGLNCPVTTNPDRICSETRIACDLNPLNGNECKNINACVNTDFFGNGTCSITRKPCDLNPLNGNECPDLPNNTCLEVGVCTKATDGLPAYHQSCAKGAVPSDCPGLTNVCVDDYGLCLPNKLSNTCEKMVAHFMGAVAHLVTDVQNDKFLARSIQERGRDGDSCPAVLGLGADVSLEEARTDAQHFTDQDMDAWIGLHHPQADIPGLPTYPFDGEDTVRDIFPGLEGRLEVPEKELSAVLAASDITAAPRDILDNTLDRQDTWAQHKTNPQGTDFMIDLFSIDCLLDWDCLGNQTLEEAIPFRPIHIDDCAWATAGVGNPHYVSEGGGMADTATEIATMLDRTWEFLRNGERLRFRRVGAFADLHFCVGTDTSDCLLEKATQVTGTEIAGETGTAPSNGVSSEWSSPREVYAIDVIRGQGRLSAGIQSDPPKPRANSPEEANSDNWLPKNPSGGLLCPASRGPGGELGNRKFDLELEALSTDAQTEIKRVTDTLFHAHIRAEKVQVRVDAARCSPGNRFLIKDMRFPGDTINSVRGDFNDDGKADIVWRNSKSGVVAVWLMNGTTIASSDFQGGVPAEWEIAGTGDVNKDGMADVIWRNSTDGVVAVWLMNGFTITSVGFPGSASTDWIIEQVADTNGDGKADLIWRNSKSGVVAVWLMNGPTIASSGFLGGVPAVWQIKGVGDVNGDGRADVLWRNSVNGVVAVWVMDGVTITSVGFPGSAPLNFEVAGLGDVDGNGTADVVWRNMSTGGVVVWLMNETTIGTSHFLPGKTTEWKISQLGDVDGDGKADIIWFNINSGVVDIWLMDGGTITSTGSPGATSPDWVVQ